MNRTRQLVTLGAGLTVAALAATGVAAAAPALTRAISGDGYQGLMHCCHKVVLGPQTKPTFIVATPRLPAGRYLVNYGVGLVIGHNDNVVCAASPASHGGNDGLFGGAGNGSTAEGTGDTYGTATQTDIITITKPGDRINVVCNSTTATVGTYVSSASVTALALRTAHVSATR